jgi:L-ascorbate metabolism protein UlaG (beta-lactamase superfamily)
MKILLAIVVVIVLAVGGFFMLNSYLYEEKQGEPQNQVPQADVIDIQPVTHASAIITWADGVIYTDPTGGAAAYANRPKGSIVLLTDIHPDHLSTSTLVAVLASSTIVVAPQAVADLLPEGLKSNLTVMKNGDITEKEGFMITAVPMYNLPESTSSPHTKGRGNGYVIERNHQKVYVAGDTDGTPEMRALRNIDIALIPMNTPYTMTVEEAADAVLAFAPKHVYPYHYRGQDGLSDVAKFKSLVTAANPNIDVVLLNWYPDLP